MWLIWLMLAAAADPAELDERMQQHFVRLTRIQAAIVDGDLAAARAFGRELSELTPAGSTPAEQAGFAKIQVQARALARAESLVAAAESAATIAADCGACHERSGANTWLDSTSSEPLGESVRQRMARHRWAVDRLWEGLIGPSEAAWARGAEALAETPLQSQRLLGEEQVQADILANQVYRLGAEARRVSKPPGRARVYARLLGICARCHELFRPAD